MSLALFVTILAVQAFQDDLKQSVIHHEDLKIGVTWPDKAPLKWLQPALHSAGESEYDLVVLERKTNLISNADHIGPQTLVDLTADHAGIDVLGTATGYQYVYYNGYFGHSGLSACKDAIEAFTGDDVPKGRSMSELKEAEAAMLVAMKTFWDGHFKERIRKNLEQTTGKTVSAANLFLFDDLDKAGEWWGENIPSRASEARYFGASKGRTLLSLHIDYETFSRKLKDCVEAARDDGYHLFNAWIALSDVEKSPLVFRTDDTHVTFSEMKAGDYVIFNTWLVVHGGADMETDCADIVGPRPGFEIERDPKPRVSADYRFFAKLE